MGRPVGLSRRLLDLRGSLGEGPGALWEPSGDDKMAPGSLWGGLGTPRDPPGWIFHGFLMESEQTTIRLAKGKLQRCHCHREPATMQRCWWHWPQAPRNWQRYLLQLKNCSDATTTGKLPRRGLEMSSARLARRFRFILRFAATMFVAFATGNAQQATILF